MNTYNTALLGSCGGDVIIHRTAEFRRPEDIKIGNHVAIDEFVVVTTKMTVGNHVHISPQVGIIGGKNGLLTIGNFCNISIGGKIICVSDEFKGVGLVSVPGVPEEYRDTLIARPVVFENYVNTGANVTILPGVTLPEGVVIGACSLVRATDELEPWTIYVGNPLRKLQERPSKNILRYAQEITEGRPH